MAILKQYALIINAGSSSLKFKIFHRQTFTVVASGVVERIGSPGSIVQIEQDDSRRRLMVKNYPAGVPDTTQALRIVLGHLKSWQRKIQIIGHRVVHGGQHFIEPVIVTDSVYKQLEKLNHLAPLHNPINLACISLCRKTFPSIKNVAVFDTAFYKHIPDYAFLYAIPYEYYTKYGIRRYGFHGISHQYALQQAAGKLKKPLKKAKIISCHLGSGNSMTAIKFGTAIETSMGFTPLEGLTMATRSGDIDPSVAFFLMRELNLSLDAIEELLNKKSGLSGIFDYSNDMRDILLAAGYAVAGYAAPKKFNRTEKIRAQLALKMYVYDIVRYIGSFSLVMGGVDYLVFTGAIGYRSPTIRNLILRDVRKFLKKIKTITVESNEELMIAQTIQSFR